MFAETKIKIMKKQIILMGLMALIKIGASQNWLPNTGNVGIGTLLPSAGLHVVGTTRFQGGLSMFGNGSNSILSQLYMANTSNTKAFNFQLNTAGSALDLWTYTGSWGNKFSFTDAGNLGINTNTPDKTLTLNGEMGFHRTTNPTGSSVGYIKYVNGFTFGTASANDPLLFQTNSMDRMLIDKVGKVGIGTTAPTASLTVNGNVLIGDPAVVNNLVFGYKLYVQTGIITEKIKVQLVQSWADYVFDKNYKLKSIEEVANFIKEEKHLPGVPSTEELKKDGGFDLAQMDAKLMEKIEELTLYVIQLNEKNKELSKKVAELEAVNK